MPTVGNKKYNYDAAGVANARSQSKRTRQPMRSNNQGGGNYKGGVRPINPNAGAVNNFMNRDALSQYNNVGGSPQDIARLQNGLNVLNRNESGYIPLKPDGIYGPKTSRSANQFFKGGRRRPNRDPRRRPVNPSRV